MVGMLWFLFFAVSQDCMSSLFVMIASFWMVFWEYKTELFLFLSLIEGTYVVVNAIADAVWGSKVELTGVLSDEVDNGDWLYL